MRPVLVVLGSREPHERRSRAADAVRYLAHHPRIDIVVFSGHNGEAQEMLEHARELGLRPEISVLLEKESRHTHDNAVKTRELLAAHGLSDRFPIILSCRYHLPRAVRTFRTVFPHVESALRGQWSWHEMRRFVVNELPRILEHGWRGHVDLGPFSSLINYIRRDA